MIIGRCGGCEFFKRSMDPKVKADGYCHAVPPQVVVFPDPTGRIVIKGQFPPMTVSDWCGAHKPAEGSEQ